MGVSPWFLFWSFILSRLTAAKFDTHQNHYFLDLLDPPFQIPLPRSVANTKGVGRAAICPTKIVEIGMSDPGAGSGAGLGEFQRFEQSAAIKQLERLEQIFLVSDLLPGSVGNCE